MNILSCFDGISCGQIVLNKLGIKYDNYYASEIEKSAIKITQYNFPKTIQLGDVCLINGKDLSKIDLLYSGSPCQGFSNAGLKTNFEHSESKLFWEFLRLLKETKPKYFLLENVVMKKEWSDIITKEVGVEPILIDSGLLTAQTRKRLYWTNIPIKGNIEDKNVNFIDIEDPIENDSKIKNIKDIPHDVFSSKNYWKWDPNKKGYWSQPYRIYYRKGKIATLITGVWPLVEGKKEGTYRPISIREAEKLQGLPYEYTKVDGVSERQAFHSIGNGWNVPTIEWILSFIK